MIAPKFWVFNLGAIAAIEEAALARTTAVAAYLVFVALTALPTASMVFGALFLAQALAGLGVR